MRGRLVVRVSSRILPLVALVAMASEASAQENAGATAPAPATAPAMASTPAPARAAGSVTGRTDIAPNGIRRDPKGVQGISPLWESIGKGDGAALARDFDAALAAYREALDKNPQNPLLHYRIAEAQKLKGDLKEAETAYNSALRFVGNDLATKAKILFCLADLSEQQKDLDQATERWTTYETFAKGAETSKVYPASAAERKKRIQEWKQLSADAAQVKLRIEKRMKEVEETTRKNAASGK